MIPYWNNRSTEILFDIEDNDIPKLQSIIEMLNSEGWKHYQNYLKQFREEIIKEGKDAIKFKSKRDLSENKWAILNGFDITKEFIPNFVKEVDLYLKMKKAEVSQNDEQRW